MTSTDAAPRRFRPRALPTLATIVAVAVFVSAGQWQQRRMHDKEALGRNSMRRRWRRQWLAAPARIDRLERASVSPRHRSWPL
jgi:cytochrome oxidase assembly protein ShyY1